MGDGALKNAPRVGKRLRVCEGQADCSGLVLLWIKEKPVPGIF
jgi:hypothetical protein